MKCFRHIPIGILRFNTHKFHSYTVDM